MNYRINLRKSILAKRLAIQSGYRNNHVFFVRAFDFIFVLLLLFPALFIIGIYYILYKIVNRHSGSFIYKGERLGMGKKIFQIYKIRTLSLADEKKFYSKIFSPGSNSELKFGKFLRSTRLDELPQLFNILKGDMSLFGPRPLRQTIYLKNRAHIPNYEMRFLVKPGLIGYAQLLTPHSAPKQIRALIDNYYVTIPRNPFGDILFILWSGIVLCKNFAYEFFFTLKEMVLVIRYNFSLRNRRRMRRVKRKGIKGYITDCAFDKLSKKNVQVVDINNEDLCIMTDLDLDIDDELCFCLEAVINKRQTTKRKKAKCKSIVVKKRENTPGRSYKWSYVLAWVPVSAFNHYKIEQYILRQSIAKTMVV